MSNKLVPSGGEIFFSIENNRLTRDPSKRFFSLIEPTCPAGYGRLSHLLKTSAAGISEIP
jgi:hypothetical protein